MFVQNSSQWQTFALVGIEFGLTVQLMMLWTCKSFEAPVLQTVHSQSMVQLSWNMKAWLTCELFCGINESECKWGICFIKFQASFGLEHKKPCAAVQSTIYWKLFKIWMQIHMKAWNHFPIQKMNKWVWFNTHCKNCIAICGKTFPNKTKVQELVHQPKGTIQHHSMTIPKPKQLVLFARYG